MMEDEDLFLGFDSSTQSLKATVLDAKLRAVAYEVVNFDSELPHYKVKDGVHRSSSGREVTSPPLMWVEALDLSLGKLLKGGKFSFRKVRAISGSAQQHGAVYWKKGARQMLQSLDSSQTLVSQLQGAFTVENSPIWQDSSATRQCREIEAALGGAEALAELTGSRAMDRYTGPHIRKLYQTREDIYNKTERISLISSFMASLLVGDYATIDYTDGAAFCLMDVKTRTWSPAALQATAPDLVKKLGDLAAPHAVVNEIHPYFVQKYRFNSQCRVIQWSGDNPNSLAGLLLESPGHLGVSMGTGDTFFGVVKDPHPGLDGHIIPNPVDPKTYMCLLVHHNGSLTRQEIRNSRAAGSWEKFNQLLAESPPLNGGNIGFYYTDRESLPSMPVCTHRFRIEGAEEKVVKVLDFDDATEVRALVEGQCLAKRGHLERFGMPAPERIIGTGGASANRQILQVMADVFGCDVYLADNTDSASLGAALRACHGHICASDPEFKFSELLQFATKGSAMHCKLAVSPGRRELTERYGRLSAKRLEIESMLLQEVGELD